MERVTFLIEATGARVSCLLNPEDLEARRAAGVVRRISARGSLTGQPLRDDPLVATGGGLTEYDLRLLFDLDIAAESQGGGGDGGDVRDRTRPLWDLAENAKAKDGFGAPPKVRFIWGKAWNVPGVILFVSERLERFDASGRAQRSWLSLRLRRVEPMTNPPGRDVAAGPASPSQGAGSQTGAPGGPAPAAGPASVNQAAGGGASQGDAGLSKAVATQPAPAPMQAVPVDPTGLPLTRLDQIAAEHYGDATHALVLAAYNEIEDPLNLPPQTRLALPAAEALARRL